jgi:arylsulfatase A-like enzyme
MAQLKPNIIYIMADDMGYADLSCFGRKDFKTPHLDKLASQGMKFTNAYAGSSLCTPTRTSFMTGRYPARSPVGLWEPLTGSKSDSAAGLSPAYPSLPTLLNKNGYDTYLVGKWHLGFLPSFSPNANGFNYFFGFHAGATDYISHTNPNGDPDLYENDKPVAASGYMTDLLKEKAISLVQQDHKKPFFLCLMFNAPHWPWQAPGDSPYPLGADKWRSGGSATAYAAMMTSMDDAVGSILAALDAQNMADNTVVIFTSDNGGEQFSDMGGLSGRKSFLNEGGIKVPAFIRWPGKIGPNSSTEQAAITMDWTATILTLAGAVPDNQFPLDGIDLMPVCTGKQKPVQRTFYWRMSQRNQLKAVRNGNWKYLQDNNGEWLYDVATDPGEKVDLKAKNIGILKELKSKYADWEKTVLSPIPLPR